MDEEIITTTTRASDILYKDVYDAKYTVSGNRVVDMQANNNGFGFISKYEYNNAIDTTSPNGRSSIKYSNEKINLYFPITTTYLK